MAFPFEKQVANFKPDVKENTKIFAGKINVPTMQNVEKRELSDGSFQIIVYDKAFAEHSLVMQHKTTWDTQPHGSFTLTPSIKEKKVLLTINLKRTSAHCFYLVVTSLKYTDISKHENYASVNAALYDLFYEAKKPVCKRS